MPSTNVLLVEDEHIPAMEIKEILNDANYEVMDIVDNGQKAIQQIKQYDPDIVMMDIRLNGEMDGIETINKLDGQVDPSVIYMTGLVGDELIQRAKATNPLDIMTKPVSECDIYSSLNKLQEMQTDH